MTDVFTFNGEDSNGAAEEALREQLEEERKETLKRGRPQGLNKTCPSCKKEYETEVPLDAITDPSTSSIQRLQLQTGLCSTECFERSSAQPVSHSICANALKKLKEEEGDVYDAEEGPKTYVLQVEGEPSVEPGEPVPPLEDDIEDA